MNNEQLTQLRLKATEAARVLNRPGSLALDMLDLLDEIDRLRNTGADA